jgi:hypothetical protein
MGNAEVVANVFSQMMKRLETDRDRFMDEVAGWWASQVWENRQISPVSPSQDNSSDEQIKDISRWQQEAAKRLGLYHEIERSNNEHVCRLSVLPDEEFEKFQIKVLHLVELQKQSGRTHAHPTLWGEYGRGCLRARKFDLAEKIFSQTDKWHDIVAPSATIRRARVKYLLDWARCAYLRGDHIVARKRAALSIKIAETIDGTEEKQAFEKNESAPFDFKPSIMRALFCMMDCLAHSPSWFSENEKVREEFTYYWQKSNRQLDTPNCWDVPLKCYAVSDNIWFTRLNTYVTEIAENLYVLMASNTGERWLRSFRVQWWGLFASFPQLNLEPRKRRKAIAYLIVGLCLQSSVRSAWAESVPLTWPTVERIAVKAKIPPLILKDVRQEIDIPNFDAKHYIEETAKDLKLAHNIGGMKSSANNIGGMKSNAFSLSAQAEQDIISKFDVNSSPMLISSSSSNIGGM